jgi:hypothetical protein
MSLLSGPGKEQGEGRYPFCYFFGDFAFGAFGAFG